MIVTVTTFNLPKPVSRAEALAIFRSTAPKYRGVPGLLQKRYIFSEDGSSLGGVYVWKTKADADAMYTPEWREFVRGKYQTEAIVSYFDSPVLVDNVTEQIVFDE